MKKALIVLFLLISTSAFAHHPLNGMPMETFFHGLLSGIGHPIVGFDHLFFILIVGVVALFSDRRYLVLCAYIAAMLMGCLLTISGLNLPLKETIIALSLMVLGSIVVSGKNLSILSTIVLFSVFGFFHGSAFAQSIVGQESGVGATVLAGYLFGLGVVQYLLALTGGWVLENLFAADAASHINARLCGAAITGVGLFLVLETSERTLLSMIGLG